jgi:Zn-finger protein
MTEPKNMVKTTNYKFFEHRECEFFPCHGPASTNCMFCYCPLAFLECPGNYTIIESPPGVKRKDCSDCTLTHGRKGWEVVQHWLKKPKYWNTNEKTPESKNETD